MGSNECGGRLEAAVAAGEKKDALNVVSSLNGGFAKAQAVRSQGGGNEKDRCWGTQGRFSPVACHRMDGPDDED